MLIQLYYKLNGIVHSVAQAEDKKEQGKKVLRLAMKQHPLSEGAMWQVCDETSEDFVRAEEKRVVPAPKSEPVIQESVPEEETVENAPVEKEIVTIEEAPVVEEIIKEETKKPKKRGRPKRRALGNK